MTATRCPHRRAASTLRCMGQLGHERPHWAWSGETLLVWADDECAGYMPRHAAVVPIRVYAEGGLCSHLLLRPDARAALCGLTRARWWSDDLATKLPLCKRCAAKVPVV